MAKFGAWIPLFLTFTLALATALGCGTAEPSQTESLAANPLESPVATKTSARKDRTLDETMRLVVIDEIADPYLLRVGIRPVDPILGPLRVSILVLALRDGSPVKDATVSVSISGVGTPGQVEAVNSPQDPGLYEADLWLDAVGDWRVTVDIDGPEKIFGGRPISMSGTHTFRIEVQSESEIQGLGSSDTQTLAWELYEYTLSVQAPLDWEWDKEFNQSIVDEVAAQKQRNVHVGNSLIRRIRGHWFEDRPEVMISQLSLVPPLYDTVEVWEGEVNGFPAFVVMEDHLRERYPVNYREPSYRVLTIYIEMDWNSYWRISCSANLAEGEDIKSCETIVSSVRFEWK